MHKGTLQGRLFEFYKCFFKRPCKISVYVHFSGLLVWAPSRFAEAALLLPIWFMWRTPSNAQSWIHSCIHYALMCTKTKILHLCYQNHDAYISKVLGTLLKLQTQCYIHQIRHIKVLDHKAYVQVINKWLSPNFISYPYNLMGNTHDQDSITKFSPTLTLVTFGNNLHESSFAFIELRYN